MKKNVIKLITFYTINIIKNLPNPLILLNIYLITLYTIEHLKKTKEKEEYEHEH